MSLAVAVGRIDSAATERRGHDDPFDAASAAA
jgi:hypothetical protein